MLKYICVALASLVFVAQVTAQEIEPLNVYSTQLYCYNPVEVFGISNSLQEQPLFTGYARVDSINNEGEYVALGGPMMFLVNQNTGTWISGMMSPNGLFCSIAVGSDFEPYTE